MAVSSQTRESTEKVNASAYMDREMHTAVKAVATAPETKYRSRGDVIRHAIAEYLDLD